MHLLRDHPHDVRAVFLHRLLADAGYLLERRQ